MEGRCPCLDRYDQRHGGSFFFTPGKKGYVDDRYHHYYGYRKGREAAPTPVRNPISPNGAAMPRPSPPEQNWQSRWSFTALVRR